MLFKQLRFFRKLLLVTALLAVCGPGWGQQVSKAEYFVDTDPGFGKASVIPVTPGADVSLSFQVNLASYPAGFHTLYVRSFVTPYTVTENGMPVRKGGWSATHIRTFYKEAFNGLAATPNIVRGEYFADTDPGFGKGTAINFATGQDLANVSFTFDITSLSTGFHNLYVRFQDGDGRWGLSLVRTLYKETVSVTPNITRGEYFIDTDPGFGNGTAVPLTAGMDLPNLSFTANVTALQAGFHAIYFRFRDAANRWSQTVARTFYKENSVGGNDLPNITGGEYFIDNDPGFGKASAITLTPGTDLTSINIPVNIAAITAGFHQLYTRFRDANGNWGLSNARSFYKEGGAATAVVPNIERVEYFIDSDPGFGAGKSVPFTPGSDLSSLLFPIDMAGIPIGQHTVYVRAKSSGGEWSHLSSGTFGVEATLPDAPSVTSFSPAKAGKGETVTIKGAKFTGTTKVSFGNADAKSFAVVNDTTITAVLANGASGFVVVTTPKGSASGNNFIYLAPAPPGNTLGFDGTNDYVSVPHNSSLKPSAGLTVEAWVKASAITSRPISVIYRKDDPSAEQLLAFKNAGTVLSFGLVVGGVYSELTAPVTPSDFENRWVHVAATFDGSTKRLYRNGELIASQAVSGAMPVTGSQPAFIGASAGTADFFNGSLDEFRFWNVARSATDLKNNLRTSVAANSTGLVLYYDFDQGEPGLPNTGRSSLINATENAALNGVLANFALSGTESSNWLESYAMVVPATLPSTNITINSFTASWSAPLVGKVESYLLDVSTSPLFTSFVPGYQSLNVGPATSYVVSGLTHNTTYYFRVRANKASVANVGAFSDVAATTTAIAIPSITTFTPASGPVGSSVTITGVNFSAVPAENIVYAGTVKAVVTAASATSLTVTIPAGATYQPLSVTTGGLTSYSSKPFGITFPAYTGFDSTSFAPKVDFPVPTNPHATAVGDLNGDGKPDLAVVNYGAALLSILPNASTPGSISLLPKQDWATGPQPNSVAMADINGDGRLDILVTNYGAASVSVFINTSTGAAITLAGKVDVAVGQHPVSLAVNDFNKDGKPDMVVANATSNTLSVLQNSSSNGVIAFAPKVDVITGAQPSAIFIADINNDGKPDLISANTVAKTVSVFQCLTTSEPVSANTFATRLDIAITGEPRHVMASDVNGDGKPDLVVGGQYSAGAATAGLMVLQNLFTSGTISATSFGPGTLFLPGSYAHVAAINDLNGDGLPDLATVTNAINKVSVLRNATAGNTTPAFDSAFQYTTGLTPYHVATGDIDGDGKPDLITANYASNSISVFRNTLHVQQNQNITFTPLPDKAFGEEPYLLVRPTASSGLPVSVEVTTGNVELKGDTLLVVGAGPVSLKASQAGNKFFHPAQPVVRNFELKKATQTILFDSLANQVFGDTPVPLSATVSSGLPVSFTVVSGNAGIQNNSLQITGAGPITVRASQAGSKDYNAVFADRTLCVSLPPIDKIEGFAESCPATLVYRVRKVPGAIYTWSVSGGTLLNQNDTAATVRWTTTGTTGTVSVTAAVACSTATVTKGLVVTITAPILPAGITNAFPVTNAVVRLLPFSISWQPGAHTQTYELYIWPEGGTATTPYAVTTNIVVSIPTLPAFAPGKRYSWKVVSKNACGETTSPTYSFEIAKLPNLVVQNLVVPTTTVFSGTSVDVSFTVRNSGLASADFSQWSDVAYLSPDQTLSDDDLYVGGKANISYLDVGQQYSSTVAVKIPENVVGQYYLLVVVNRYRQLTESNDVDNVAVKSLPVNLTPPPDLQVTAVVTPYDAFTTQNILVDYVVKNKGGGATKVMAWTDKIYLCPEPVFDPLISIALGENYHDKSILYPDSSYRVKKTVQLPSQVFGVYYIFVATDVDKKVYEFTFENNNTARNDSIKIYLTPPPDLVVTKWTTPARLTAAERFASNYTVQNKGASKPFFGNYIDDAPAWYAGVKWMDAVFISKEPVFNSNATMIGFSLPKTAWDTIVCPWMPTEEELRRRMAPPREVFVAAAAGSRSSGSSSSGGGRSFSYGDMPMKRTGNSAGIKASRTYAIRSVEESEAEDNDTDIPLQVGGMSAPPTFCSVPVYPALLPNETYSQNMPFKIPDTLSGVYYLYLFTDVTDTIYEYTKESNNWQGVPITIVNPDLTVNNVRVGTPAASGNRSTVQWTIKNNGSGKVLARTRKDFIWLSPTSTFSASSAILLDSLVYNASMDTAASLLRQMDVRLPDGISGSYYIIVETDRLNKVFESNEANNRASSEAFQITLTPWPDLLVTAVNLKEDTVEFNQATEASVRIANRGTANLVGKTWTDAVYSSPSPNGTAIGAAIKTVPATQGLLAGDSLTLEVPITITAEFLKYITRDTTFYIYAKADAGEAVYEHTGEGNNLLRSKPFRYLAPDLTVSAVKMADSVKSGRSTMVEWIVKNSGGRTGMGSKSWIDAVYFSPDSVITTSSILVGSQSFSGYLTRDSSYKGQVSITPPNGLTGNYYVIVVTDYSNNLLEKNRGNNVSLKRGLDNKAKKINISLTPPADIIPVLFTAPAYGLAGQPVLVKWKIKNQGTGGADGFWRENIYLSTNQTVDEKDAELGSFLKRGGLTPGEMYEDSLLLYLPATAEGNYYLLLSADHHNNIYEHLAENNNLVSGSLFITKPQPSDLVVTAINMPPQAIVGDEVLVEWKVSNIGINPSTGYFRQGLYLSKDTAWTNEALLLTIPDTSVNIPPQGEITMKRLVKLKGVTPGDYRVLVRADLSNNIVESVETNNDLSTAGRIAVGVNVLPLAQLKTATLLNNDELYYKIDIPDSLQGQTILVSLKGAALTGVNELYLRHDSIPARNRYDHAFDKGGASDHDVVIPSAKKGVYYVMVYSTSTRISSQNISLLAQKINFGIHSVASTEGGNSGMVTIKVKGARFVPGMELSLQQATLGAISAQSVQWVNSTTLFVTFNLKDRPTGVYTVQAKNNQQETAQLVNGFSIIKGQGGGFQGGGGAGGGTGFYCTIRNTEVDELVGFDVESPANVRFGTKFVMSLNFGNSGNVDIPMPTRILVSVNGDPVSLTAEGLADSRKELYLEFKELGGPEGILRPGATGSIKIYVVSQKLMDMQFQLVE